MNTKDKMMAELFGPVDLLTSHERDYYAELCDVVLKYHQSKHAGAILETLSQLHDSGPVWDGDVCSKSARDALLESGAACKVLFKGGHGCNACTYLGAEMLKAMKWLRAQEDAVPAHVKFAGTHAIGGHSGHGGGLD